MFLTQPPVVSLVLELLMGWDTGRKPEITVRQTSGITMACVMNAVPLLYEQGTELSGHRGVVIQGTDLWSVVGSDEYRDRVMGQVVDESEAGSDCETDSDIDRYSDPADEDNGESVRLLLDEEEELCTTRFSDYAENERWHDWQN